ncbi:SGNH/GDSL hydrolase family protein [Leptospira sp. 'Mane']|uniref:SGNH/GDSL hydrolase family protein n=1 Tax=Leptospira sp. 'Mane' TaxID=3387407 RepID=UPI00398A76E6
MKKQVLKRLLIYIILAIFYLGLVEGILRLFDSEAVLVKSFDDSLLFSLHSDKTGRVVSEEYNVEVKTNENGGRQTLSSDSKYPILLLGDSFTEGWGVKEEEIFSQIANQVLPKETQIKNLGVHGSCPALFEIHLRSYVPEFQPKEVWIQIFDNDLDDNEKLETFMEEVDGVWKSKKPLGAKLLSTPTYNFIKESSLFRLLKRIWKFGRGQTEPILYYKPGREPDRKILSHKESLEKFGRLKSLGTEIDSKYNGQFVFYKNPNDPIWKNRLGSQTKHLTNINNYLKSNKIKLNLIYIPAKEFFAEKGILGNINQTNLKQYESQNPHLLLLKEFCEKNQLRCLYTTELFWDKNPEDLYFPFDAHWNSEGHKLFGQTLGDVIRKSAN